jgi:transposase
VRRKFDEALKAQGNKGKAGKASKALLIIQKLYRVETLIKGLSPTEKQRIRQQQSVPILNELKDWMDKSLTQVTPSCLTGKALRYMVNQWSTLIVYCDNGSIEIDNNGVERAIRPFVIGRRNWLFSDTVKGAKASANLYSLIETAKLNGLEPYRYLRHILTALPKANSLEEIDALLPWAVDKETINEGWAIV